MNTIPILSPVADDLERVEQKMREAVRVEFRPLATVMERLLNSGGKRVRPAVALMATKFYPTDLDKSVSLASALELLHTATLVHDDMIDNSLLRRGNRTVNSMWNGGATVLAGDFLFARAAALAAETESVRVMSIFANTLMTICNGELKQIFSAGHGEKTREDYYERIFSKTASLFAAAAEMGGVLSGAPERQIQALRDYGYNLGMAFQIVDDVLDFIGDEEKMGKPVGSDLRQGIVTLPTLYFLQSQPGDETVLEVLGGQDRDVVAVKTAVSQICASGAIEPSLAEARHFVRQGQVALKALPDNVYRQAMWGLGDYVVARQH